MLPPFLEVGMHLFFFVGDGADGHDLRAKATVVCQVSEKLCPFETGLHKGTLKLFNMNNKLYLLEQTFVNVSVL